ncbi:MAG: dual specificity protein phosphatase family protein [Thermogladius sp.]|nr:dual specificity protein phosphatase family protein [Thermogladius sp.]
MKPVFLKWIIPGSLAQSPRPTLRDVEEISGVFTGVVNLLSEAEKPFEVINALRARGVEVFHAPTLDFHPVELIHVLGSINFIEKHLEAGGRVLVHCSGGVGRSSQVTASYLVYKGYDLFSAVKYIRGIVDGALEVKWQVQLLEDFADLLDAIGRSRVRRIYSDLQEGRGWRELLHASKLLQFTIELARMIDLGKQIVVEALKEVMERRDRPELPELDEPSSILRLAEELDYDMSGRVVVLDGVLDNGLLELRILCDTPCEDIALRVRGLAGRISLPGLRGLNVEVGSYMDYVF